MCVCACVFSVFALFTECPLVKKEQKQKFEALLVSTVWSKSIFPGMSLNPFPEQFADRHPNKKIFTNDSPVG